MPVHLTCQYCGSAFSAYPSELRKGRRFCSSACAYDAFSAKSAMTDVDAFWLKVDRNGPTPSHCPEIGACWVWTGALHLDGYGYLGSKRHTPMLAHRRSWEIAHAPITDKQNVLHHCDNPPCVRPDHLFLGTHADNMRDMVTKGRDYRNPRMGESHPFARLSENNVREIRALYKTGQSMAVIAEQFHVSKSAIQGVVERKNWKHVS